MPALAPADILPKTAGLSLTRATSHDAQSWDNFVECHPEGRFCHLWGYKRVLEEAVGYRCVYLNILSSGKRAGVFPSVVIRRGSGRLISQPFSEYGGPLMQGLSEGQLRLLPDLLIQAAAEEGCRSIEIRGGIGCEPLAQSEACCQHPLYFYGILGLSQKEQLWRKSLTNEARKDVARAKREGLTAEIRSGTQAVSGPFYSLYVHSMRRLGVPPHSDRFFTMLAESFGNHLAAVWVGGESGVVAILLGAVTGKRLHIFLTASDPRAWRKRPNDLAHWTFIEWAASRGLDTFDFGSARYPGQIQFKKKWGVTLREYSCYTMAPAGSAEVSKIQTVKTDSRSMVIMSHVWRMLVPSHLGPMLGPPLRKRLTK